MTNKLTKSKSHASLLISSLLVLTSVLSAHGLSAQTETDADSAVEEKSKSKRSHKSSRTIKSKDGLEEILVTGAKVNLMDAQAMKREAQTMVDAISAEEIGQLSDRSSIDAIQRLPGVAIERFAGPNDPDHFSVEGSDIILRGMNQTRSEFNGRDSFSAYSGRGLSYRDVPPELLGGIMVYKNQTADMVEGGVGGTINLITRKPLDADGRVLAFSADESYGDLIEQWSPTFSGLYSDIFDSKYGRFGVLVNYVDSKLVGVSHGIQSEAFLQYYASQLVTENDDGAVGTRAEDFVGEDGKGIVWLPSASNLLMKTDTRERQGFASALQFESTDETVKAVLEYIRSDSSLAWHEQSLKYQGGFHTIDSRKTRPLEGTHFVFDENGLFQAGTLTNGVEVWRVGPSGHTRVPTTGGGLKGYKQWGHKAQTESRVNDTSSLVEDLSFNVIWQATDDLTLTGDVQYIQAESAVDDVVINLSTWAHMQYDLRGSLPTLTLIEPWNGVRDATRLNDNEEGGLEDNIWDGLGDNPVIYPGFTGDDAGDQNYFNDENSYLWRSAMDHYERSEGDSTALRFDADYKLDFGIAKNIKAGYRFSERDQVVRATSWNWGALAPEWQSGVSNWSAPNAEGFYNGIGWLPDVKSQNKGYEKVDWSNFMGGGVVNLPGNQTINVTEEFVRSVMGSDPNRRKLGMSKVNGNWEPYPDRPNVDDKFGLFTPDEINTTLETRNALYVQLDFEGDGDLTYSGNVGLRYLKMERDAAGIVDFPVLAPRDYYTQNFPPEELALPLTAESVDTYINKQVTDGLYESYKFAVGELENNWVKNPYFYLPDVVRKFAQHDLTKEPAEDRVYPKYAAVSQSLVAKNDYTVLLPSFNIKVDLTSDLVARIAFAKSVAFPNMGDVRNRTEFEALEATREESDNIVVTKREVQDDVAETTLEMIDTVRLDRTENEKYFIGEGGNPFMKPMESLQYDFSLEWYFSDVGQLSAAVFHKNLSNYFSQGIIYRDFTHPVTQVTQQVAITSNRNGGDAKLDGLELNYHQFFTGIFEGFGIQATYTLIDANSVPNNEKRVEDEQWFDSIYEDTGIRVNTDKLPLQGVSDHTINFIGMFENQTWSARLAYNWRSKYLLTTRDVISKAPQWYNDHGELDGSVFYSINDNFSVGIQAENMTNARSEIVMILNDDLLSTGRSWFEADRRFSLVLKGEF